MSQLIASPSRNRFTESVVIITGASRGIGIGIVNSFVREGAKVVLVGRDEAALLQAESTLISLRHEFLSVKADVSKEIDVERVIRLTIERFGRIDVLCHNAGVYPKSSLEDINLDQWREVIDINLTGTFLMVKVCLPVMRSQQKGKIVITSSISGPKTGLPGFSHYTASKGGVMGFIRTAAIELAKYNININAVEPGNIITDSLSDLGDDHNECMLKAIPLGRMGTPEDVANAILFLASSEASFITGQSIVVDGGQTLPESHYSDY